MCCLHLVDTGITKKSENCEFSYDFRVGFSARIKQSELEMNKRLMILCCISVALFIKESFMQNNHSKTKLQLSQNVLFLTNISKTSIFNNIFMKIPPVANIVTLEKKIVFSKFFLDMKDIASDKRVLDT